MLNKKEETRVLGRLGARELTESEYNYVGGSAVTGGPPCTFNPKTQSMDGDCPVPFA